MIWVLDLGFCRQRRCTHSYPFVVSRPKRNSGPKEPSCREQRDRRQSR